MTIPLSHQSSKPCDQRSVGVIVTKGESILLMRRGRWPIALAAPAGHQDEDPTPSIAALRELYEEVGLEPLSLTHVLSGSFSSPCRRGSNTHHWEVYKAEVSPTASPLTTEEAPSSFWTSPSHLTRLARITQRFQDGHITQEDWDASPGLEPVWVEILSALHLLPKAQSDSSQ